MTSPYTAATAPGILGALGAALLDGSVEVVDLTAPLSAATPVLPLPPGMAPIPPFALEELARYDAAGGDISYQNGLHTGEHVGTHFDAPCHWITGIDHGDVASVPVDRLVAPAVVIDVTARVAEDPDFVLQVADLRAWEREHGGLPRGWLLVRSGWSSRGDDQAAFLNADETGPHTPGMSAECARWIAEETPVLGVGVETIGIDAGLAFAFEPPFPAHHHLLGAAKYGLTQLRNLDRLPVTGAVLVGAPLKIVHGSGSPVRALALVARG
ncbi:kynurenine formamidase [Actinocorallia herbida]|uniref:Kynurenine formamidase n=1 Tax=Actinocorallia herbida TaxID=58109 RepID=A0A3N1CXK8_9ACTN|nr:cyclase family protein [Actinocorallia herbida]ROO86027.1 kynurenine formamidase [Actinocorallia herbida]